MIIDVFSLQANQSHYKAFVVAWVRLDRLEVCHYIFMGHCLAFAAILIRE
jgi:hypothetical protein